MYNSNGEIISERITRIFWSSNNAEFIGREEKDITYLDGKPSQATERKYYNESGKMSFAKYIDSYVYENGKERKVETQVFNEKTGELGNSNDVLN